MPHLDIDVDRQLERLRERRWNVRFQWHATGAIRSQRLVCLPNVDRRHGVYHQRLRRSGAGYRETMRDRWCDHVNDQQRQWQYHDVYGLRHCDDCVNLHSDDGDILYDDAVKHQYDGNRAGWGYTRGMGERRERC